MKKALVEKTKDMGLSKKAIDDLIEIGINGLDEDATDDDIVEKVDSLALIAKAMQGEVTRKTQKSSKKPKSRSRREEDDDDEA